MEELRREERVLGQRVILLLKWALLPALIAMGIGVLLGLLDPAALQGTTTPVAELPAALLRWSPMAWMSLGLMLLMLIPAARVLVLLAGYYQQRRWAFVLVALAILGILSLSVFLGLRT